MKEEHYPKGILLIVILVSVSAIGMLLFSEMPEKTRVGMQVGGDEPSDEELDDAFREFWEDLVGNKCKPGLTIHNGLCNRVGVTGMQSQGIENCDGIPFPLSQTDIHVYPGTVCMDGCIDDKIKWCKDVLDDAIFDTLEFECSLICSGLKGPSGFGCLPTFTRGRPFVNCAEATHPIAGGEYCTRANLICTYPGKCTCRPKPVQSWATASAGSVTEGASATSSLG